MTTVTLARQPERTDLVRAVCVREWREALGNKLLVGMTLLPPAKVEYVERQPTLEEVFLSVVGKQA